MLDVFGSLRLILKRRLVQIDNTVFRLHWLFTCFLLIMFSVLLTARQYVGEPITCFTVTSAPPTLLNTYCWVHATFTIEESFGKKVGLDVPHPGIDNSRMGTKKFYPYYQWVCFVLFLQAILFYVPHYVWKVWEGGLLEATCMGLTLPILTEDDRTKRSKLLIQYLMRSHLDHRFYAIKYFTCELLCLFNVIGQMWLLDRFFDGEFWNYGFDVISCPVDRSVSDKVYVDDQSRTTGDFYLYIPFRVFRFLDGQRVSFSCSVVICNGRDCPEADCGNGTGMSYGRRRRRSTPDLAGLPVLTVRNQVTVLDDPSTRMHKSPATAPPTREWESEGMQLANPAASSSSGPVSGWAMVAGTVVSSLLVLSLALNVLLLRAASKEETSQPQTEVEEDAPSVVYRNDDFRSPGGVVSRSTDGFRFASLYRNRSLASSLHAERSPPPLFR